MFEIDPANSLDRSESLGLDRIGYRSTHFVCTLGAARDALEEYEGLGSLKLEIQVRTVLQHAWAELAHDRSFKFGFELPTKIQRKLNLFSGMLEVVDSAFDEIAKEIDAYKSEITGKTASQISDIEIDSISVLKFITDLAALTKIDIEGDLSAAAYGEMRKFGLKTIGDLERLVTPDFLEAHAKSYEKSSTAIGIIRRLMMFDNLENYAKTKPQYGGLAYRTYRMLQLKYSKGEIKRAFKGSKVRIFPEEEEEE